MKVFVNEMLVMDIVGCVVVVVIELIVVVDVLK